MVVATNPFYYNKGNLCPFVCLCFFFGSGCFFHPNPKPMEQIVDLILGFMKKYFLLLLDFFWQSIRLFRLMVAPSSCRALCYHFLQIKGMNLTSSF